MNDMVEADLIIKGGKVFYEGDFIEGGVAIVDDKILKVGKDSKLPAAPERIDAEGKLIMPGLIDLEATLPPFETTGSEDFRSLTMAAVHGGFTTIFLTPDSRHAIIELSDLMDIMEDAAGNIFTDLGVFGSLFPTSKNRNLGRFVYGLWGSTVAINADLRSDLKEIIDVVNKPMDVPVFLRITDIVRNIGEPIGSNSSNVNLFYSGRNSNLERSMIETFLREYSWSNKIALLRVSLSESILRVKALDSRRGRVQSIVPVIYMFIPKKKAMKLGCIGLMSPPPRDDVEIAELIQRLVNGDVAMVCSGHEPIPKSVKSELVIPGVPTIDVTLRMLLTLAKRGLVSLQLIPEVLSRKPARFLELKDRGVISEGYKADLIIVEHRKDLVYDSRMSFNAVEYSPLDGELLCGYVTHVFKRGSLIYEDGSFLSNFGSGKVLLRSLVEDKKIEGDEMGLT
ncbi:MAG: dihydroorotase family protein [Thermoproteota archaeon]